MKFFVYIIKSSKGHYYTGMTEDLELDCLNITIKLNHFGLNKDQNRR